MDHSTSHDGPCRLAFTLRLDPHLVAEYRLRHEHIWPELLEVLRQQGVRTYSIFHLEASPMLFAYVEVDSLQRWREIGLTPAGRRWRRHMSDILETDANAVPVSISLTELFHFETRSTTLSPS